LPLCCTARLVRVLLQSRRQKRKKLSLCKTKIKPNFT
jgi:hypothetical protein